MQQIREGKDGEDSALALQGAETLCWGGLGKGAPSTNIQKGPVKDTGREFGEAVPKGKALFKSRDAPVPAG